MLIRLLAIIAVASLLLNCQSNRENLTQKPSEPLPDKSGGPSATPAHLLFQMSLMRGGGFTGLYSGYCLYESGRVDYVRQFPGRAYKDSIMWTAQADPARVASFRDALMASGVFKQKLEGADNMTTVVTYKAGNENLRWSWGDTGSAGVPEKLLAWYEEVTEYCTGLTPGQPKN